jgi:hypothetical protein
MNKKTLIALSAIAFSANLKAQDFTWAKDAYYSKEADGKGVVVSKTNGIYIIGDFTDTLNFGSTPVFANNTNAKSGFLAKYDTSGNFQWVVPLKGTTNLKEVTTDGIAIDKNSNIFVTGKFIGGMQIGTYTLTEPNGKKAFYLVKFDSLGNVLWADAQIGSSTIDVEGKRVVVDNAGNAYVCGKLKGGSITFGGFTLTYSTTTNGEVGFIAKYSPTGTVLWAKTITNTTNGKSAVENLTLDSAGNIYIAGKFDDICTLGDGTTQTLTPSGAENFVIAKLNPTGGVIWAFTAGINSGTNKNSAKAIGLDPSGNVYATGEFQNAISFDNSGNFDFVNPGKNSWVAKWTNNGTLLWVRVHNSGSNSSDEFKTDDLAVDDLGNLLIIGKFTSTVQIGNLPPMTSSGGKNTFLVKYSTSGTPLWVKTITGTLDIEGKRLAIDNTGKAIICGSFKSNAVFGGTVGTLTYNGNAGVKNFFVARHNSGMYITPPNTVGISNLQNQFINVSVFPNPFTESIIVKNIPAEKNSLITLVGADGRIIFSSNTGNDQIIINTSHLSAGIYFLNIRAEGKTLSYKVLKN